MRVNGLDHVNIRTRDVAASAHFYADVLGLRARNGPPPLPPEQVQWLCDHRDQAIIHLFRIDAGPAATTGAIDHVALACSGKVELLARLKSRGIEFQMRESPTLTQIFIRDPHGVRLELNFLEN